MQVQLTLPLSPTQTKTCPRCGIEKPTEEFNRHRGRPDGLQRLCRLCQREDSKRYDKSYWLRHNAEILERRRLRYRSRSGKSADPAKSYRERSRAYYARHATEVLARQRAYRAAHPDRHREYIARRRALIAATAFERVDYRAIRKRDGSVCHICGEAIRPDEQYHFDHVVPLARGGQHVASNIRVAHAKCNLKKWANPIRR